MIEKLKSKGFTINQYNNDVLDGEFNGINVNLFIGTNNNKVFRIGVVDAHPINETDIRIRFNKLLQQFQNNSKYIPLTDSILLKRTIIEGENISYGMKINKKRYEAAFFQKTAKYDSLTIKIKNLKDKQELNNSESSNLITLMTDQLRELCKCFNKSVWFMINDRDGKFYISMYYDNEYNRAKGDDL